MIEKSESQVTTVESDASSETDGFSRRHFLTSATGVVAAATAAGVTNQAFAAAIPGLRALFDLPLSSPSCYSHRAAAKRQPLNPPLTRPSNLLMMRPLPLSLSTRRSRSHRSRRKKQS